MKYSQVILVTCVGGATLASAIPTPSDSAAELNARGPTDKKNIGMRLGKAITYGGTFAQKASGFNSYDRRGPSKKTLVTPERKQKVIKAGASLKKMGSDAVEAGGGGEAIASNLGSIAHLVKGRSLDSEEPVVRDLDEDLFSRAFEDELEARGFFSNLKTNYRQNKAESTQAKADSTQVKADRAAAKAAERPPVPSMNRRDFDELALRDLEDELIARGFFSNLKTNYRQNKAESLQSKADATQIKADKAAAKVAPVYRRGLDEIDARDFDDELVMRDLEEELAARGILDGFRALRDTLRGSRKPKGGVDPSMDPTLVQRDFEDFIDARDLEDELAARGIRDGFRALKDTLRGSRQSAQPSVDPTLTQRDLEDLLDARDLEDEIAARGIRDGFRALKDTLRGSRQGVQPSTDPTLTQRNFFEALDTREINELD